MKENKKVEKQHFVPQFLLKNFSINNRQLWVYDKLKNATYISSIRDIASNNNFYELESEEVDLNTEEILSNIESDCAPIITKIINSNSIKDISENEHSKLCLFAALQFTRTSRPRETVDQFIDIMIEYIKKDGAGIDINEILESKRDTKDISILSMYETSFEIMNDLLLKKFSLFTAPSNCKFIISDNPITLFNHKPRNGRGNLGTRVKYVEIYFPISPKHCLVFTCSTLLAEIKEDLIKSKLYKQIGISIPFEQNDIEYLVDSYEYRTPILLKEDNMLFHNSLQICNSTRFIYSNENDFNLAKEMISENQLLKYAPRLQSN